MKVQVFLVLVLFFKGNLERNRRAVPGRAQVPEKVNHKRQSFSGHRNVSLNDASRPFYGWSNEMQRKAITWPRA